MSIKIRTLPALILCAYLLVLLGSAPAAYAAEPNMRAPSETLALQTDTAVIYYVMQGGSGDCTSWATACDMQTALTTAGTDSEIWAAAGVYKPTTDPTNRAATFQLKAGVAVYGGFAGTESSRDERDPAAHVTILSGDVDNNDSQTPIITDLSTVTGNGTNSYHVATGADGAILDGVTISAGNANGASQLLQHRGGGMHNDSSSPTLTSVTFSGNAASYGGGMYNSSSSPTLTSVTFSGNSAGYGGGMFNISNSSPTLTNVTFSSNSATYSGGGMSNYHSSSPELTNVTFSGNSASNGGGMYSISSSPVIRNTILWGDTGGEVVGSDSTSTPTITSSVVQGGCPVNAACTNLIDTDPWLGALGDYGGDTQTIPLLPGSSAIDAGDDSLCPVTDQRGVARVGVCDIGAFEHDYTGIYYVVPGGSGTRDGQSWENAADLQNALRTSRSGDEIWAAAGAYKPAADPAAADPRTTTFQLKAGVAIYGGFAGTEAGRDERNPAANVTILSGDLNGDDGANFANNGENCYHVVTGADGAILDGVTITAGNANGAWDSDQYGGGMVNAGSSPTLNNVTFSGNSAWKGGGMYNDSSSPTLTGVTFSGNSADTGGGMYNSSSSPTLSNVTFSGNVATTSMGGGMYNASSSPALNNVAFNGNTAGSYGGGVSNCANSSPTLTNVTFSGNGAGRGGGMHNDASSPTLTNVTFSSNVAIAQGGGMYNYSNSSPTLTGVTFSGNSARLDGGGMFNDSSSPTLNDVTFSSNVATLRSGGGMVNYNSSSPTLTNVTFSGNSARSDGGGMYNDSSSPALTGVTFGGNSAQWGGGGMYNYNDSGPTLTGVTFSGNSAQSGGGMSNNSSSPTLTNVTFNSNSAGAGGGIFNFSSSPTLTNATFSGNVATEFGGGMYNNQSSPLLQNTIVWGDTGGEVVSDSLLSTITASVVQGGCPEYATCTNVIDIDPRLGALGDYGGATQTIPLLPGSSAIDAGADSLCPATDQRGVARPQGAHCDIGAFEAQIPQAVTLASFDAQAMADRILLSWETVSEANNAGFNLYRSSSPAAPDALLAHVPSQAPGSTQGAAYTFEDTEVAAGQTWYYWLEDVDLNGATSLHGPVSATLQAPTAVTLDTLQAQAAAPDSVSGGGALVAALIAAACVLGVRRRSRAG